MADFPVTVEGFASFIETIEIVCFNGYSAATAGLPLSILGFDVDLAAVLGGWGCVCCLPYVIDCCIWRLSCYFIESYVRFRRSLGGLEAGYSFIRKLLIDMLSDTITALTPVDLAITDVVSFLGDFSRSSVLVCGWPSDYLSCLFEAG